VRLDLFEFSSPAGPSMRAFVLTGYGAIAENVRLAELPDPVAGAGEVVIEIHAASLNPIDFKTVRGDLKRISKYKLPRPFGFDASSYLEAGRARGKVVLDVR
jgi:alcohol dehydrogenase